MLSYKTCVELIYVIDGYVNDVIDRIFSVFGITHLIHPTLGQFNREQKLDILLKTLRFPPDMGPFTDSFRIDLLQHMVEQFYRFEEDPRDSSYTFYKDTNYIEFEDRFLHKHKFLANSLKRDGYIIKGTVIKKLLPNEIEEAKTEDELSSLLDKFNFATAKGHLEQARNNHAQGNWAGANSQFRPFIESVLIDITKTILPDQKCESAGSAINLLSHTTNPSFLKSELNEVKNKRCETPFVEGFWKRLHPEGSHPGLSDEEDSTFRYHISIVFAHYLLKRLEKSF